MKEWPTTSGGDHEPYIDRVADEMPHVTRQKTVAAYGTVNGYPWSLVLFKKKNDPEDDEPMAPDYRPAAARLEFFLGGSAGLPGGQPGGLGGGGGAIRIREDAYIDTTGHTWPTEPPVIGYSIFATDAVHAVDVMPEGADPRTFKLSRPVEGFPRLCVFFPPYLLPGAIRVLDEGGRELRRRDLFAGDISPGAIIGGAD